MTRLERAGYRHIGSFRREEGGLYAVYVLIYSVIYGRCMAARHRNGRHGWLMANGRCTWCGVRP